MTETHLQKQKEKQKQMVEYIASFINLNKVLWTPEYRQPVRKKAFFFPVGLNYPIYKPVASRGQWALRT